MIAPRRRPRPGRRAPLALALLAGVALVATRPAAAQDPEGVTEVKVERVRPAKEKLPTLTFLRANRDFIRARFDRLREKPLARDGDAAAIDARFLTYAKLLAEARAAQDTVRLAEDERSRRHLLESITELGSLEAQLDQMEHELADQRIRLAAIEDDFIGRQRTQLMVIVKGYPAAAQIAELAIAIDDGDTLRVTLSDEQRESLRRGGLLEVFHGAVEPREQVVQVTVSGDSWPAGDTGYLTLEPARDRLTFLRFDLSAVQPAQGGASIQASTWLHEAPVHSVDG